MAEILLWATDKGPAVDQYKAGDVIHVAPDGWEWSEAERTHPDWRIVRVPVLQSTVDALLSRSNAVVPAGTKVRRREWTVDVAALGLAGPRTADIVDLTRAQVMAAVSKKP